MTTKTKETVKDLAQFSNVAVAEVIQELTKVAPEVNWTANTPVPQELAAKYRDNVKEYRQASGESTTPAGSLTSSDGGASLQTMQINREANQFAIIEAVGAIELQDIITAAVSHTLDEIHQYEQTKAAIWEKYAEARLNLSDRRSKEQAEKLKGQSDRQQTEVATSFQTSRTIHDTASKKLEEALSFFGGVMSGI